GLYLGNLKRSKVLLRSMSPISHRFVHFRLDVAITFTDCSHILYLQQPLILAKENMNRLNDNNIHSEHAWPLQRYLEIGRCDHYSDTLMKCGSVNAIDFTTCGSR
ncbi:hypothetical protein L9F63_018633, partial [Diploptera punctata]